MNKKDSYHSHASQQECVNTVQNHRQMLKKHTLYLQPIITQYFIDNKSEIWLLFLIAHSKR